MKKFLTLDDVDVAQKVVMVRADLNVPMQDGKVTDATRIERLLSTMIHLRMHNAKVILISHFGRPKGQRSDKDSLRHIIPSLSNIFAQDVFFANDCIGDAAQNAIQSLETGQILLLENLRFHAEEEKNDTAFAKELASLADIYVNDAFSCSHRAHASVVAITQFLPSYAGRGMQAELEALTRVLQNPRRPLMAIVAGSKISTKLDLLQNLVQKVDHLVVGGGMANTFLKAQGYAIGASLCEDDMLDTARLIIDTAKASQCNIILPQDVAVATDIQAHSQRREISIHDVAPGDKIVDIGKATMQDIHNKVSECATVVWNGPVGIFEIPPFDEGSTSIAHDIAKLTTSGKLVSVAGGGDTLAALAHAGCEKEFTYTSTAGGAFLEWLEGKTLPGVDALKTHKYMC